jgi:adenosylmethionine-8-amino-7-oxononanoate aminotransferase
MRPMSKVMIRRGVLTRPFGNVIVLMLPYCTTPALVSAMKNTLFASVKKLRVA